MKTYLRILSYGKGLGGYLPLYTISVLFYAVFSVLNIALLVPMLEVLFGKADGSHAPAHLPGFELNIKYFSQVFDFYFYRVMEAQGQMGALKFVGAFLIVAALFQTFFGIST